MKLYATVKLAVQGAMLLTALGAAGSLAAQDTIVALGRVEANGVLANSQNTVGGIVTSSQDGTGDYNVTVTAAGAFTGAVISDFILDLSIHSTAQGDDTIKGTVLSVTNDQIVLDVRTDDVEDPTNSSGPLAQVRPFDFVIRRIPSGSTEIEPGSRFLKALGRVEANGTLADGFGVDGITVSSVKNNAGDYTVTLTKTGEYAADALDDHLILVTAINGNDQDQVLQAAPSSITNIDSVTFAVRSADVQDSGNENNPTANDNAFWFTIYQLTPSSAAGVSESNLLTALAQVQSNGNLLAGSGSIAGSTVLSSQIGTGDYRVTVNATGAFAGKTANDFVAQATLNQGVSADEGINANIVIVSDDVLAIDVNTNDLEASGEAQGVATNAGFYLSVYTNDGFVRPDLRIGTRQSLTSMRGDDIINSSGGGQVIRPLLEGRNFEKFYFASENDGNSTDDIRIGEAGLGSEFKTKYFLLSGGRSNVTAKVRTNKIAASDIRPGRFARFEGQVKYRNANNTPRGVLKITGTSAFDPAASDTVKARIKPQN